MRHCEGTNLAFQDRYVPHPETWLRPTTSATCHRRRRPTSKAFELRIPESDLSLMKDLLKLTPVADSIYENSLPDDGRRLGLPRDWLVEAKRVWETDFNW